MNKARRVPDLQTGLLKPYNRIPDKESGGAEVKERWINPFFKSLMDAVFPDKCILCNVFITNENFETGMCRDQNFFKDEIGIISETVFRKQVCSKCLHEITFSHSPSCPSCGISYPVEEDVDHFCGSCLKGDFLFNKARSVAHYNECIRDMIFRFKYHGKLQLARSFEILLFSLFIKSWVLSPESEIPDFIIPVPLHMKKLRKREFNQSILLIKHWRTFLDLFNLNNIRCDLKQKILVRSKWTDSQTGLGKAKRLENIKGAFQVTSPEMIRGKHILLVDDVFTTGATLNECARVLLKNNAKTVDVITLARRV